MSDKYPTVAKVRTLGGDEVCAWRAGERDIRYGVEVEKHGDREGNLRLEGDSRLRSIFRLPPESAQVVYVADNLTWREELYDDVYRDWMRSKHLSYKRFLQSDTDRQRRVKSIMGHREVGLRVRQNEIVPESRSRDYRERLARAMVARNEAVEGEEGGSG